MKNNDYLLVCKVQDRSLSKAERFLADQWATKLRSYPGAQLSDDQRASALELLER